MPKDRIYNEKEGYVNRIEIQNEGRCVYIDMLEIDFGFTWFVPWSKPK